jgi:hypothetical protein
MSIAKKHLGLKPLIDGFKQAFKDCKDDRREASVSYSVLDTALSTLDVATLLRTDKLIYSPGGTYNEQKKTYELCS